MASLKEDANRLESLLPKVMRHLYTPDQDDPLTDLSVPQIRMMRLLSHTRRTASSVGEELKLSVSAVTQMVNRLEAAGLVAREDDVSDRRIKHLTLTERGDELLDRRRCRRQKQAECALAGMSEQSRLNLLEALEQLALVASKEHSVGHQPLTLVAELEQRMPLSPDFTEDLPS